MPVGTPRARREPRGGPRDMRRYDITLELGEPMACSCFSAFLRFPLREASLVANIIMVVFIKGMECYKVDYNDNLERINARSSRSDRAMALVGAVDAVPPQRGEAGERRIFA